MPINIAMDGAHRGAYALKASQRVDVADVAGVPYLVAIGEMQCKAIIPARVDIGEDTDALHISGGIDGAYSLSFLAISAGMAALLT